MTTSKAESEMSTRQKRKHDKEREKLERNSISQPADLKRPADTMLNVTSQGSTPANGQTPLTPQTFDPSTYNTPHAQMPYYSNNGSNNPEWTGSNIMTNGAMDNWMPSFEQSGGAVDPTSQGGGQTLPNFNFEMPLDGNPFGMDAFQQPYIPRDLWSMPMTFEWDWADMGNFANNNNNNNMGGGGGL